MTSNWHTGDSVYGSQNFRLRFSGGSTSDDSSLQRRFVTATNTVDERDVIVISDSSCGSSPDRVGKSKWKSISTPDVKNKEFQIHFLETSSSDSERESGSSWNRARPDDKSPKKISRNKTVIQANKVPTGAPLISKGASSISHRLFDALLASDTLTNNTAKTAVGSNANRDRDQVNESKKFIDKSKRHINSHTLITEQIHSKQKEKYNIEEINKVIKPSCATYNYSPNVPNRHPIYNTPKQDSTGKIRLTKKDAYKIFKNIKDTQVYDSPRMEKETNVIINESTDIDEDVVHPAVSPSYNKRAQFPSDSPDVIDSSLKNDILLTDSSEPPLISISRVMDSFRPLSERRKRQIKEWVLTNFGFDFENDSSFNTVPPSTRNSSSGNSSLERLEKVYETPNNRGRINKVQTDERQAYETPNNRGRINNVQTDEKQRTIVNSDRVAHSSLIRQTTLDQYFKKIKNSEFCTPDNKPRLLPKAQTDKKASSVANTFGTKGMRDCADISDKLYGTSWRDKANALVSTESRKISNQPINKIVQTERKPASKNQYHADTDQYRADSDSDKSDLAENKVKSNRGRNIQRKRKEMDSFINDDSSSDSDSEAYYTALTNPTNRVTSSRIKSIPESIKRLQALWDTDTEDEKPKSKPSPKDLHRRKLSFSDDESSRTSEFDPEDYVPPKYTSNKEVTKKPIPKVASKFESTVTKPVRHRTFLASLSNTVPMNHAHPDAQKYRLDYKNNKEELCKKLYDLYNEKVFGNKLPPNMSINWNVRMTGTAGYCYNKETTTNFKRVKSSRIELATKIVDMPDRLRDTLIHEACHAAAWLIDGVNDGHGSLWTKWANRAMKTFPELPPIRRCHNYEIKTKFTYKCTSCGYSVGRHSKSLDIKRKRCGYCYGKFELLINKTTKSGTVQVQTLKKEPTGFALYVKQNYNAVKKQKRDMKHADVMKLLGQQFSAIKISKGTDVASN